jgi:putative hydrolase of the HAD superfamily
VSRPTHILFDFFGTLVRYVPHPDLGYHESYARVRELGARMSYVDFMATWDATAGAFERRAEADGREFSMVELGAAFLDRVAPGSTPDVESFVECLVAEWSVGVTHLDGLDELLATLARDHRLAVVSNTNSPTLVPSILDAAGLAGRFDAVLLSVDIGWRKPHPAIYRTALERLDVPAERAVFVGDSYGPDYAGPSRLGIRSYLIDPGRRFDVAAAQRLDSVFDLPARLAGHDPSAAGASSAANTSR